VTRLGLLLIGGGFGSYLWGWIGKEVTRQWDQQDPGADPSSRSHRLAVARQQTVRRQAPVFRRVGLIAVVSGIAVVIVGVTTR